MVDDFFDEYLQGVFKKAKSGVREESYYGLVEDLVENFAHKNNRKLQVDSFPKKTEGGNPDIRVLTNNGELVGYIECKEFGKELETLEDSEQLERYRGIFPNLILTNFLEFRLFRDGKIVGKPVKISDAHPYLKLKVDRIPIQNEEEFKKLFSQFIRFSTPRIYTAKKLAIELANRARFLRDEVVAQELRREEKEKGQLYGYYEAFKKYLIGSLTYEDFADLYAQTITYGLFIARHRYEAHPTLLEKEKRSDGPFNRELAYKYIQPSLGLLRDVFQFVASAELPVQIKVTVDDIADLLAAADLEKVVKTFHRENGGKDPIIHFYETFLAEYDPETRERRGVYYTPEPVVSYIIRSVHDLLKEKLGKEDGFASKDVTVLDPAAGTLTFPAYAITQAVEERKEKYGEGGLKRFIKEHILQDFYAFELMMAPYAVGHLKIDFILERLGYTLEKDDRFKLYLTNTLEFKELEATRLPGMASLSEESKLAGKVKREVPILVILGNPPYSGISENKGEWILNQIKEYLQIEREPLGERKHWLQDDYVKFFRFAQWKIEQVGSGVLGFITNHAWLDNPTFRGMRYSLLKTFDEIYLVNLHGSTLKKEKTPQGGKDENVFDIRPGVAISIFIKKPKEKEKKVFYTDIWGLRDEKYNWLEKNDISSTKWELLSPSKPYYFLIKRKDEGQELYDRFLSINQIFPVNSTGIVTARDNFVIDQSETSLRKKIEVFRDKRNTDNYIKEFLKSILGRKNIEHVENYAWRVARARLQLQRVKDWENYFTKILYRPFDERWIYYHPSVVWRTRDEVMRHMLKANLGLVSCRQQSTPGFHHALVADSIADDSFVSNKSRERGYVFPLYLYSHDREQIAIFEGQEKLDIEGVQHALRTKTNKTPNLRSELIATLNQAFNSKPVPEQVFYYIYAVLYSNKYREKYQEFLKIDFPRVPFTKDYELFQKLAELGEKLVALHLLKGKELSKPLAKFRGRDSNLVERREYDEKAKRVYINAKQYFEGVKPEVWNYYIGGYQVLDKWLKDRKGRSLSDEEVRHYCRVVTALVKTIKIQKEIDKLYSGVEKNLI